MSTENKLHNDPERPWDRIRLTGEMPEGAYTAPVSPDDALSGFVFDSWRSVENPRELLRLVDKYSMLSHGGAALMLNDDVDQVWTHLGRGEKGPRAAVVRITSDQFRILEGRPFWGLPLDETDPPPDEDSGWIFETDDAYLELLLDRSHPKDTSRTDHGEGDRACHA